MINKPYIKICGITRKSDLECAIECGADAVGFIAYPKSPRYVSPSEVKYLIDQCNCPNVNKVAVFVDEDLNDINKYLDVGIDVVQLHGNETAEFSSSINCEVWRAIRLKESSQVQEFHNYPCSKFLIDSFVKGAEIPGGTGHVADWDLSAEFISSTDKDVLRAGGITRENVKEAYSRVMPFGFDLSSGVETMPGFKDPVKIREFFEEVKLLV